VPQRILARATETFTLGCKLEVCLNRSEILGALAAIALPLGAAAEAEAHAAPATAESKANSDVVAREVAAFNAHDAAAVARIHAADAAIALVPSGKALSRGAKQNRAFFERVFLRTPKIHLRIDNQYVLNNIVVNHYVVTGGSNSELIGIYHVKNGAIANEWLILG
jgi:hypothetical protein